jgi:PTS system mannose-specific IIB component
MIVQAAPPGVKVHVVPIWKIIEVSKDPRFGDTKAMLLFETPQDLLRALEGGVDIKEVNLGSMAHSQGKVVVTNAVAMDAADVECIEKIASMGVKFDVRKVPADNPEPFDAVIKKAKAELEKTEKQKEIDDLKEKLRQLEAAQELLANSNVNVNAATSSDAVENTEDTSDKI